MALSNKKGEIMQFGNITQTQTFVDGKLVSDITRAEESVRITTIAEAQDTYAKMLEDGLLEPAIRLEKDLSTGEIKRVVKSWVVSVA